MILSNSIPKLPGLVIAYHGCDRDVADKVISGVDKLKDSDNAFDWLGPGQYFWENSVQRAIDWAVENSLEENAKIRNPAVVGAIIDLGMCLNLVDSYSINLVKSAYDNMKDTYAAAGRPMPKNVSKRNDYDLLLRYLDCAVIKFLCERQPFDTVRGVFPEGQPIYAGSGFRAKTHIQICVKNPGSIKGYFFLRG